METEVADTEEAKEEVKEVDSVVEVEMAAATAEEEAKGAESAAATAEDLAAEDSAVAATADSAEDSAEAGSAEQRHQLGGDANRKPPGSIALPQGRHRSV